MLLSVRQPPPQMQRGSRADPIRPPLWLAVRSDESISRLLLDCKPSHSDVLDGVAVRHRGWKLRLLMVRRRLLCTAAPHTAADTGTDDRGRSRLSSLDAMRSPMRLQWAGAVARGPHRQPAYRLQRVERGVTSPIALERRDRANQGA